MGNRLSKAKLGQLLVQWGKLPNDQPDVIFSHGGDGANKCDSSLLYTVLCCERPRVDCDTGMIVWDRSLVSELELRGYDLTTLRLSIMKKAGGGE